MSTSIEWTDHTLNPGIYGCTEVSPACANCYAATMAHRLSAMGVYPEGITEKKAAGIGWSGKVIVDYDRIGLAFDKLPKRKPARVFVTSMSDLFHEDVPFEFVGRVFEEMAARPHLTFQVLTKRPERMKHFLGPIRPTPGCVDCYTSRAVCGRCRGTAVLRPNRGRGWPSNVWAGTTVEDQKRADERIPHLLRVPAPVRFLSCEPLAGAVNLASYLEDTSDDSAGDVWGMPPGHADEEHQFLRGIQWVIAGGESGPKARPSNPAWFRSLRDQCAEAGVPFFFKQWGRWSGGREFVGTSEAIRKGWVNAHNFGDEPVVHGGRAKDPKTLDGVEHRAFPTAAMPHGE